MAVPVVNLEGELWKPVAGGPQQVSNMGRVHNAHGTTFGSLTPRGYRRVCVAQRDAMVHRLVLDAFVGPCPEGMEACHNDGNRTNNKLSNLRWDTRKNNHADKHAHGTWQNGERNGRAKFTDREAAEIRQLHATGVASTQLAKQYNVAHCTIRRIVTRRHYSVARQPAKLRDGKGR